MGLAGSSCDGSHSSQKQTAVLVKGAAVKVVVYKRWDLWRSIYFHCQDSEAKDFVFEGHYSPPPIILQGHGTTVVRGKTLRSLNG